VELYSKSLRTGYPSYQSCPSCLSALSLDSFWTILRRRNFYLNFSRLTKHFTAALKVLADILFALDTGDIAVLTLLDLSAAFDTVDHATLLRRLDTSYGISGTVLGWFASYLSGRIQTLRCGMPASDASVVLCGPILFLLYTADLVRLVECHNLRPHM